MIAAVCVAMGLIISMLCLLWLWQTSASLGAKLVWTLICLVLPGWGALLMLELWVPQVHLAESAAPPPEVDEHGAPNAAQLRHAVLGLVAVMALMMGLGLLLLGSAMTSAGDVRGWSALAAALSLLATGGYFTSRGARRLDELSHGA